MSTTRRKSKKKKESRPASYWEIDDPLTAILENVSGQARRQMITDFWNAGNLVALDEELLKDELDPDVRVRLGRIHPFFMGGEYLPERLAEEVTIVRINLQSTTYDVIELRARRQPDGSIGLRWVDEYDTAFVQPRTEISKPFSFSELVEFIEESGPEESCWGRFPLIYNVMNNEALGDPESLRDFTAMSSDFYPELSQWCADKVEAWIEELCPPVEEEDYDDEE